MTGRIPPSPPVIQFVYFLLLNDGEVYTGTTAYLSRRIEEHQAGKVASTKHRRPIVLIGYEAYQETSDARRREAFLKTTEGRRLFRKQYRDILIRAGSPVAPVPPHGG